MLKSALGCVFVLCSVTIAHAGWLDITSITTGASGGFTGTLNGIAVTGTVNSHDPFFVLNGVDGYEGSSTTDDSAQFSYAGVYTPATPAGDQIGYTIVGGNVHTATITLSFGTAVTNPVFHVANLDSMLYDFSSTLGLGGLTLLTGNGGSGDGLQVLGNIISDADPGTLAAIDPGTAPPTTGPRSAYGSVQLNGTFTTLVFDVTNPSGNGDGGSFSMSAPDSPVPEPGTWGLMAGGLAVAGWFRARRRA